jgi:hypothetical protein
VSVSVRGPRRSLTMNVLRTSNHHTPPNARVVADALKRQRGDRMVFVVESQHAAMGASTRAIECGVKAEALPKSPTGRRRPVSSLGIAPPRSGALR